MKPNVPNFSKINFTDILILRNFYAYTIIIVLTRWRVMMITLSDFLCENGLGFGQWRWITRTLWKIHSTERKKNRNCERVIISTSSSDTLWWHKDNANEYYTVGTFIYNIVRPKIEENPIFSSTTSGREKVVRMKKIWIRQTHAHARTTSRPTRL